MIRWLSIARKRLKLRVRPCARVLLIVIVNNQTGKADETAFPNDDHRAAAKTEAKPSWS